MFPKKLRVFGNFTAVNNVNKLSDICLKIMWHLSTSSDTKSYETNILDRDDTELYHLSSFSDSAFDL